MSNNQSDQPQDASLAIRTSQQGLSNSPKTKNETHSLTAQQRTAMSKAEREADIIQDAVFAAGMAGCIPVGNEVGPSGFKVYLDRLLKDAGNPTDPIERMMIQQLALAHHRIAQLHIQATEADTVEAATKYTTVAIRLTGELRRMSLAVRQYRQPMTTKQFTVVKQQNLTSGDQQVAYLDQSTGSCLEEKDSLKRQTTELTSNRLTNDTDYALPSKSEASCSRPPQPQATQPIDRRGA